MSRAGRPRRWLTIALVLGIAAGAAALIAVFVLNARKPLLLVYSSALETLVVVPIFAAHGQPARELPCLALGRWAQRVGETDGHLVVLDGERRSLHLIELTQLRDIAAGRLSCSRDRPRVRSVKLQTERMPYMASLAGGRLFVSYFADNVVEEYGLEPRAAQPLVHVRSLPFSSAENLGLSDVAVMGTRLLVAGSGYRCFARECPEGRFGPSRLYFVDLARASVPPLQRAPDNLNSAGLYLHAPDSGYVISAGDYHGGHSSLQRIAADLTLGSVIRLPVNAAARKGYRLDARFFAVSQFSGEHLFVLDAARGALAQIARVGKVSIERLGTTVAELPARSDSDIQDLIADPTAAGRFLLVDSRRDRIVHAEFAGDGGFTQLASVSVKLGSAPVAPSWGFPLSER